MSRLKLSANLGFLWTEHKLPDAVRAAKAAGFDAVECHFPYAIDPAEMTAALEETGLPMLGLNTVRGNTDAGDFGLCALPERLEDAHAAIDQAVDYAKAINARGIHVMAGRTTATSAGGTFAANLRRAAEAAPEKTILIEPINHRNAPDYYLHRVEQAAEIIETLRLPNIKIMFDIYHIGVQQGDVIRRMTEAMPHIGHIQFAAAPSRNEPDEGEIHLARVIGAALEAGYDGFFGAEYVPRSTTDAGLGWMATLKKEMM